MRIFALPDISPSDGISDPMGDAAWRRELRNPSGAVVPTDTSSDLTAVERRQQLAGSASPDPAATAKLPQKSRPKALINAYCA